MKISIVLILFLISNICLSSINELVNEFALRNSNLNQNKLQLGVVKLNVDAYRAQESWILSASAFQDKNDQISASTFNQSKLDTSNYSLGISRYFKYGGTLSFSGSMTGYDRSRQSAAVRGAYPIKTNQFANTLSYSQSLGENLFGRSYRTGLYLTILASEQQKLALDKMDEGLVFDFYSYILTAKLNKTLVNLQGEALKRSVRRRALIAKRVRDGLREKVDLYEAEIAVISQREALNTITSDYQLTLQELSNKLHREMLDSEINAYNLFDIQLPGGISGDLKKNVDYKMVLKNIEYNLENLKKVKYGFTPTITMAGELTSNAFKQNQSDALSDGAPGEKNKELLISLNVSMPFGFKEVRASTSQRRLELLSSKLQEEKLYTNLKITNQSFKKRIMILKNNVGQATKKLQLAKKALRAQNRLYNLGRTDLDRVIRSEEGLIQAERTLVGSIISVEQMTAGHAVLFQNLKEYLAKL